MKLVLIISFLICGCAPEKKTEIACFPFMKFDTQGYRVTHYMDRDTLEEVDRSVCTSIDVSTIGQWEDYARACCARGNWLNCPWPEEYP